MKSKLAANLSAEKFYDFTSGFYEQMIDFDRNMNLRVEAYKEIFPKKGFAADIGCGIGLDSIALARNGHNVSAFDISPQMIESAKINSEKNNLQIDFKVSSIASISKTYEAKFDYVVCVGNTIAHLNGKQLQSALIKIHALMKPGGKVILHILNYNRILRLNSRINNIANREGKIIIRFYDFFKKFIRFNILVFDQSEVKKYNLIATKHYPHSQRSIVRLLKKTGFRKIKSYGDFGMQKYYPVESKDLFIEAIK